MLAPTRHSQLAVHIFNDGRPKYLIAAAARMPGQHLSGILSGKIKPSASARARLADVLNTSVADLFPDAVDYTPDDAA
jgi:transcriptional regulator with XRE-family HTH domain